MNLKNNWIYCTLMLLILLSVFILYHFLLKNEAIRITDESLIRQTTSFLAVSTIKTTLAIIEGSSVGGEVSAVILSADSNIEIGDIVQAPYDFIDFIWKILLLGIIILTVLKMLFLTGLGDTGIYLLGAGILLKILSISLKLKSLHLHKLSRNLIVLGSLLSLFVPVLLVFSYHSSEFFVEKFEKNMSLEITELESDWTQFRQEITLKDFKGSLQNSFAFIKRTYRKMIVIMLEYVGIILLKFIFFPIIFGVLIYQLAKHFFSGLIASMYSYNQVKR
ncbi:MAG: hypothetical protein JW996_07395 [Candidatus Cloacimonetes bacterium]|nr:hypothetical protein [Candidatus Cloacimonadota bacterium]